MTPSYQSTHELQWQKSISGLDRPAIVSCVLLFLIAIVLGSTACSKLTNQDNTAGTGGGGQITASPDNSNSASSSQSSDGEKKPTTWEAKATSLSGTVGQTFTMDCSPGGTAHSVWGSDIYTADSSICTAGVHSGLITYQEGGAVTIELRPGRAIYGCSERNGVTTSAYGSYQQSFVFKTPNTEAVVREAEDQVPVLWNTSAAMVSFEPGKTYKFRCPSSGKAGTVWGTDIYTLDSSICTAAVHADKLTTESGGSVTIELRPGESAYKGSTRNGITTNDYAKYGSSFVVKDPEATDRKR